MDVAVVGGGLAGLVAAVDLARAGRSVTLFERSGALGGRARTNRVGGFHFNVGPHALYRDGTARRVLRALGVEARGAKPPTGGGFAIRGGVPRTLPAGPISLLASGLVPLPAKLELARFLAGASAREAESLGRLTVAEWLEREASRPEARAFLAALVRVTTYANDPHRQGAAAALAQLQLGLGRGVLYLDGGWQSLVDGLHEAARRAGVRFETGAPVRAVEHDEAARGVRLGDGTERHASAVVLAVGPADAAGLAPRSRALGRWAEEAIPVRAACLDLALTGLPRPHARFALGVDAPLYFSVHSDVARLAPEGGALLHVMRYLGSAVPADAEAVEAELEALADLLQPGWRPRVVHRRFVPNLVVSHGLHTPAGRPGPLVPDVTGLAVAGDWVGGEGMLADAAVASARLAAEEVGRGLGERRPSAERLSA